MKSSKTVDLSSFSSSSLSLPDLVGRIQFIYMGASDAEKSLIRRIYRYIWRALLPIDQFKDISGVVSCFWALDIVRSSSCPLSSSELSLLSFIYYISDQGNIYINSGAVCNSIILPGFAPRSIAEYLTRLKRKGYLLRSYVDPANMYLQIGHNKRPVFIKLTPLAIDLLNEIQRKTYKLIRESSFNYITGKQ